MADSGPAEPETAGTPTGPPKMPRWVKVSGIIVIALLLVFLGAMALGIGGEHGPGRHFGGGSQETHEPSGDHTRPPGHEAGHQANGVGARQSRFVPPSSAT